MMPNIVLNWPAILIATLVAFAFGGLWYGPLFGMKWAKLMGMNTGKKPTQKEMMKGLGLQLLGLFLTTYIMAHTVPVWRASVWNAGADMPNHIYGFCGAVFVWVGFYIPMQLGKVAWEMRSWKLFAINAAHDFITLQIIAQIIAHWR